MMINKINIATISGFVTSIKQLHKQPPAKSRRFKPLELPVKPHLYWYLRRYQNRIIDFSIVGFTVATFLILLIKNWR